MTNIDDLIRLVQSSNGGAININVTISAPAVEPVAEAEPLPYTDFTVGDEVLVCHTRKDGTPVHTYGTVDTVLGKDDYGYYTRVTGENGKHYKTGIVYNEERKGSRICLLED